MLLARRSVLGVIAFVLLLLTIVSVLIPKLNPVLWLMLALVPKSDTPIPFTTHIVLFQFKQGTSHTAIKEVTAKMLGLKKTCVHPSTGYPYIASITGGRDNSIENLQNGVSHAFILQFYTSEDRDYYVDHDPAHQAFKEGAAVVVEKAQVVDFQDGVFV